VFYDLYVPADRPVTASTRGAAALEVSAPGAYVSHHTAAVLWNLWVPDDSLTHVSVPAGSTRSQRRGVRAHHASPNAQVRLRGGLRLSAPAQTFLELAGHVSLVDLVVLGDSIVQRKLATPEELIEAASSSQGRGVRLARRAASLVRRGVDSAMESRLRMLIVLAGLPEPAVNHIVHRPDGQWMMRFDLCYPDLKLVIEYDGRQHAESDAQWGRDIGRREDLDRRGWRIIVIRSPGVYTEPGHTLDRIVAAMRDRGAVDLPRRLRDEWRQHFPGRSQRGY